MSKELTEKQKWRGTTKIQVSSDLKCICLSKEGVEFELTVPFEHRDSFCKWFDICNKLGIKKWRMKNEIIYFGSACGWDIQKRRYAGHRTDF